MIKSGKEKPTNISNSGLDESFKELFFKFILIGDAGEDFIFFWSLMIIRCWKNINSSKIYWQCFSKRIQRYSWCRVWFKICGNRWINQDQASNMGHSNLFILIDVGNFRLDKSLFRISSDHFIKILRVSFLYTMSISNKCGKSLLLNILGAHLLKTSKNGKKVWLKKLTQAQSLFWLATKLIWKKTGSFFSENKK